MKINSFRLGRALRAGQQSALILLLLTCISLTSSQANCQKEIHYRMLQERFHALENGTDITTLSDIDLLLGKPIVKYADVVMCIDANGFITKTSTYTYGEQEYYPNRIYQTIETPAGLDAFDDQGVLIVNIPNDPAESANIPGVGIALSAAEISGFGINMDFSLLISSFQSNFINQGGSYWNVGNKNYFSTSAQELIIALDEQYLLSSQFDHSGALQSMYLQTVVERNGMHIPQVDMQLNYDELSNGSKMQTTHKDSYLNYTVIENGQTILQYVQEAQPFLAQASKGTAVAASNQTHFSSFDLPQRLQKPDIGIYPNPAHDFLNIELNGLWSGKSGTWTIKTTTGQNILSGRKEKQDGKLNIVLPPLSSGMYLFHIETQGTSISKKFIIAK